jgi:hypothetical protein
MNWPANLGLKVESFAQQIDLYLRKVHYILSDMLFKKNWTLECFQKLIVCWESFIEVKFILLVYSVAVPRPQN